MPESLDRRVSLRVDPADYAKVEEQAAKLARKPAEIMRAALVLGVEVIEKQGDKAVRRALSGGEAG